VLVDILVVARNDADDGRYPFPFSKKLGSHEGMNRNNYFLLLYWSGCVAQEEGAE
jgi:hypothetical protein